MPRQQRQRVLSFWSRRLVPLLSAVLLVSVLQVGGGEAVVFNFRTLTLGNLKLLGDAHLKNGSFRLSRDLPVPNSGAGRALYAEPVRLRHPATRVPLPFSTFFSFSVINLNPSSIGGGLAFLLAPDDTSIGDAGGFLGLVNATASAAPGRASVVAVEFDTRMDVEFGDINGNHVGVDLGSLVSAQVADLDSAGIDLKSGDLINAWIEYSGGASGGTIEGLRFLLHRSPRRPRPLFPGRSRPVRRRFRVCRLLRIHPGKHRDPQRRMVELLLAFSWRLPPVHDDDSASASCNPNLPILRPIAAFPTPFRPCPCSRRKPQRRNCTALLDLVLPEQRALSPGPGRCRWGGDGQRLRRRGSCGLGLLGLHPEDKVTQEMGTLSGDVGDRQHPERVQLQRARRRRSWLRLISYHRPRRLRHRLQRDHPGDGRHGGRQEVHPERERQRRAAGEGGVPL
ncbi:unnamed protein product [Musa textilis]